MKEDDLPLAYRASDKSEPSDVSPLLVFRQIVFALGAGLLLGGIGLGFGSIAKNNDVCWYMGWGGALIALCIPLPRWR